MTETPSVDDFKGRTRNPKWERELLDWLRQQPENARFEFLMDLLKYQEPVALILAHRSLQSRSSFVRFLEFGVANRDASSIKYYLDFVVPRLGFHRTIDNLLRLCCSESNYVEKALYWLPRYAASDSDQLKLKELTDLFSTAHVKRGDN